MPRTLPTRRMPRHHLLLHRAPPPRHRAGAPPPRTSDLVLALLVPFAAPRLGPRVFVLAAVAPAATTVWAATRAGGVLDGRPVTSSAAWVPGLDLTLDLPAGRYRVEWADTRSGEVLRAEDRAHDGGRATLESPKYNEDVALRVVARAG